jgi:hypothetical protein
MSLLPAEEKQHWACRMRSLPFVTNWGSHVTSGLLANYFINIPTEKERAFNFVVFFFFFEFKCKMFLWLKKMVPFFSIHFILPLLPDPVGVFVIQKL